MFWKTSYLPYYSYHISCLIFRQTFLDTICRCCFIKPFYIELLFFSKEFKFMAAEVVKKKKVGFFIEQCLLQISFTTRSIHIVKLQQLAFYQLLKHVLRLHRELFKSYKKRIQWYCHIEMNALSAFSISKSVRELKDGLIEFECN